MHDGAVVVAHLAGVSEPPAVAAAVVCAVGVAAVFAHGQNGSGPDPGILVELGRPGVLVNNKMCRYFVSIYHQFLYPSVNLQQYRCWAGPSR